MITKQQILQDFTVAFKEKDQIKKRTLTSIKAEILVFEKSVAFAKASASQENSNEVNSEKLLEILKSMAKKRRESITAYESAGRDELAKTEKEELEIIKTYLPEQMPGEQAREVIEKVVNNNNFTKADFGKAMGMAMGQLKGKADGNIVSKILKEVLQ